MLFLKVKDKRIRRFFKNEEHKQKSEKYIMINLISKLKEINSNQKLHPSSLFKSLYSISRHNRSSFKSRIVRRCVLTNKARGVEQKLKISRNVFRNMLQFGLVPGYKKAVW